MTLLARRNGWVLVRTNSAPVAGNENTKCLNFFRDDTDDHWALVFGAHLKDIDDNGVLGVTYELMWLRSGDDRYSETPPPELPELFQAEIASFVAWLKLTNQWPEQNSISGAA